MPVLVSHLASRVLLGARAVLFERFDVPTVFEQIERWGVTDLPLIGGLFRTRREQEIQRDLIILVTPTLVRSTLQ